MKLFIEWTQQHVDAEEWRGTGVLHDCYDAYDESGVHFIACYESNKWYYMPPGSLFSGSNYIELVKTIQEGVDTIRNNYDVLATLLGDIIYHIEHDAPITVKLMLQKAGKRTRYIESTIIDMISNIDDYLKSIKKQE